MCLSILPQPYRRQKPHAQQEEDSVIGVAASAKRHPGGRPKVTAEIRDLLAIMEHERLVARMHSKNEGVAVRDAEALLDRGYGRPVQWTELVDKEATPMESRSQSCS
jgi:hypothetical protein